MGPKGKEVDIKIGTVNLGLLGRSVKRHRENGKINHIYILGQLPVGFGSIDEIAEEE